MPFDWMHVTPTRQAPAGDPFADQQARSIRERARLLCNLGYDAQTATRRIRAALEWEIDPAVWAPPGAAPPVAELVEAVYRRLKR